MRPFLRAIDSGINECFDKLNRALDGWSKDELRWRPTLQSNSIDWMVWHMARVEDNLVNVVLQKGVPIWERRRLEPTFGHLLRRRWVPG